MTASIKPDWQLELINRLVGARPESKRLSEPWGRELFHYTTAEGLKGIVENNCLWATSANYLNDASEIEYGCLLLNEVFAEWQSANDGSADSLGVQALNMLRSQFNDPRSKRERNTAIYVACFCESDNLLGQWRAYGQVGGYSIGFPILGAGSRFGHKPLSGFDLLSPENPNFLKSLVPVIYDKRRQAERLHQILTKTLPILDEPSIRTPAEAEGMTGIARILHTALVALEHLLLEEIVAFKNEAFAEEREWRIVMRPRDHKETPWYLESEDEEDLTRLHFRTAKGLLVPYTKLVPTIPNGHLPISSVRFGPSLEKSRVKNSLSTFLLLNGYRVKILGSEIPVLL